MLMKLNPEVGQNILNNSLPILTTIVIIVTILTTIISLYHFKWLDVIKTILCSAVILVFMRNTEMFYLVGNFIIKTGVELIEK